MPPGTVGIVLVAALAHAIWNTVSKYKRGDTVTFVWAYTCAATLLCLPLAVVPLLTGTQALDWRLAIGAAVSAALHLVYSLTLQAGYDRHDLGVVYPVARGTGPVLTMIVAIVLLGERLTAVELLGAAAVVAGILVVVGNPLRGDHAHPLGGLLWGAATGATIASYTVWDSYSITALHAAPVTYFTCTYLLQAIALTPGALRRRERVRADVRANTGPILTVAVFSPLAYVLVLTAMQTAPVALVAPLRESSIVVGAFLAWRLFHESNLARRVTGAVIVLAGIAAISL